MKTLPVKSSVDPGSGRLARSQTRIQSMADEAAMVVLSQAIEDVAAAPPNEAATAEMAYMAATTAAIEVAATAAATVESTLVAMATATGDAMHPMTIVAEIAGGEDGEEEGEDGAGQKRRRNRQSFSRGQVQMLEHIFTTTPMPRQALLNELSQRLDIPTRSVRVWFQNRRQRVKAMHQQQGMAPPVLRNAEDRLTSLEKLLPDLTPPGVMSAMVGIPQLFAYEGAVVGTAGSLTGAPSGAMAGAVPTTGAYRAVRLVGVHGKQPVFRMEELSQVPNLMRSLATGSLLKALPGGAYAEYAPLIVPNASEAPAMAPASREAAAHEEHADVLVSDL